ncbi:hypothetical protein [Actinoplanes sp. G11-F43]|uniref:hypothetical protein n=1 Tax=Actinoplanes sp. G11-F43 TaxID=3424130 RepID=UPI003D344058
MAANHTPADLAHQVLFPVAACAGQARQFMFQLAAHRCLKVGRRVYVLGVRRDGQVVLCQRPGCDHPGTPYVIPAVDEIELAANDPGYKRPVRAVEWQVPGIEVAYAIGFDWPPAAYWLPWWRG